MRVPSAGPVTVVLDEFPFPAKASPPCPPLSSAPWIPPRNTAPYGPATPAPSPPNMNAAVMHDSAIPVSAICGESSFLSRTQEPSTDANGSNVFQTGNWYASRPLDGAAT